MGIQKVYENCPAYLKPHGPFINVGAMEGIGAALWSAPKNLLWPRFLGGTPRKYIFQQTNPNKERLEYLVKLVEEGKLTVTIDQVFDMEDALQVSYLGSFPFEFVHMANALLSRHMSGFSVSGRKEKL